MKTIFLTAAKAFAMLLLCLTACKKEPTGESSNQNATDELKIATQTQMTSFAIYNPLSVNWDNRTNGATYTTAQATSDFGNVTGWDPSNAYTTIGKGNTVGCRITLLPNALSSAGGMVANVDISDGSAYEMDYDVKFHANFNWGKGGKVGFGFLIGEGNAGGDPAWDGNGGSLRLMWFTSDTDSSRIYFRPYLYYKDQPGQYGDDFGKSYPSSGALVKNQWYHIHLYAKSNTGSNTDGHVQIVIDGNTVLDQDIRWTTNDAERLIRNMSFHTFRGGSEDYWMVSTTDYIYYDNLVVTKISS